MLGQPHITQTTPQAVRQWYIQVDGQAYGPFTDQVLWQFMCEKRVTAQSLITQNLSLPYRLVSSDPALMSWIAQVPDNTALNQTPQAQTAKRSVFVVMAEIRSGRAMDFLRSLQGLGTAERIGDSVWLLQAAAAPEDIRNILSQPLSADDRLFVLDSFENRTAWFNIGADMDRRIRGLWDFQR